MSVGSIRWVSVRGGGDYLENGDAESRASRPSFIYREQGVEWRGKGDQEGQPEAPGSVSSHYISLHCMDDVAILAGLAR